MRSTGNHTRGWAVAVVTLAIVCGAQTELQRALDKTIDEAAIEAADQLKQTAFEDIENIAILPLWGTCPNDVKTYVMRTLQSRIIGGPYRVMERSEAAWTNLLSEMEWDELREDVMNPETLQRFGRIEGCDAVLYGTIRECAVYPDKRQAVTRLNLTLGVVETGQAIWSSGEIRKAKVIAVALVPPVDINPALARAVNRAARQAAEQLQAKALGTGSFAFFPLEGKDPDGYVSGVLHATFAEMGANPSTVSPESWQAYLAAHAQTTPSADAMRGFATQEGHPAVMFGTVNERQTLPRKYKAVVRFTLNLVNAETGQTIWSPGEILGEARLDNRDIVMTAVRDPIVWVVAALIVLFIIWRAFKKLFVAATKPR